VRRQGERLRRKRLGESHPDVGESWGNLGELLAAKGGFAEAERDHRQAVRICRSSLPPGNVYIAGSLLGLGGVMVDQRLAAEAEPLLLQSYTTLAAATNWYLAEPTRSASLSP
jgi:hypothetical protein